MNNLIVNNSTIHGKGVFANKDFKKGEVVIKYNLKKLTKEQFDNLSEEEKHFTSIKEDKIYLFPSPERYVNHSCESNTNPSSDGDIAIKNIKSGEEITTDYRKDDVPGLNMKCNCKSKNCKMIIKN
ncbi:MAG: SET domain-containing protein-lysine N-methyltransferase [Nanoarchaeota archaeon]